MNTATQIAPRASGKTIRDHLESDGFKMQVAKALPRHLTPERFIRVAATSVMRTPLLSQCDQASFFNALLQLSQYGLEPDGRRAHLIPFKNNKRGCVECQLIIDYKGLAELVMRSGVVSYIHADVVCENDVFDCNMGEIATHKIDFKNPRGKVYAAYAICKFKDGTSKADVMTSEEVEAVRKRSRAGQSGPWVTDWNEMAKKTVFRRLSKWLPLSSEVREAAESDDDVLDLPRRGGVDPIVSETVASLNSPEPEPVATILTPDADNDETPADFDAAPMPQQTIDQGGADRDTVSGKLADVMLDKGVSESAMLDYAKRAGLVPEPGMQLFELPTANLEKLISAVGVVALRTKAGGAK